MKALFFKYKSVVRFVVLFLGTYLVLSVIYGLYLSVSIGTSYHPDFITHLVAEQSSVLISGLGYKAEVIPHASLTSMQLFINQQYLAEIIEGCNAVGVIILFIAFVIAFAQKWKKTLLFIFGGTVILYGMNLLRIAILAIALYKFPEYQEFLHAIVFPGLIYGTIILLWMYWVRNISNTEKDA